MIFLSIALLLKINSTQSTKHFILPLLAGVILFRPTIITLVNGQLSGMLLLLTTCIAYLWEKNKWWQGAVLLAILAIKPSLGIPIIGLLSVYLILQKKISSLIAMTVSGILLILVGLVQNPHWITEFLNEGGSMFSQTFGVTPTIWGVTAFFCNNNLNCTVGYGICASLLFLVGYLYLVVKKRNALSPSLLVSLPIAITLLLTPYTWPYDQLLLIVPIVTITMMLAKDGYGYLPVSLLFLAIDIFAFILLAISGQIKMEIWSVGVPLFVFGLLVWQALNNKRVGDSLEQANTSL